MARASSVSTFLIGDIYSRYEMPSSVSTDRLRVIAWSNNGLGAGPVMHFQGSSGEVGWSCGYKNMQMQISHLLQREKVQHSIQDGSVTDHRYHHSVHATWLYALSSAVVDMANSLSSIRQIYTEEYVWWAHVLAGCSRCAVWRVWLCARCSIPAGLAGVCMGSRLWSHGCWTAWQVHLPAQCAACTCRAVSQAYQCMHTGSITVAHMSHSLREWM